MMVFDNVMIHQTLISVKVIIQLHCVLADKFMHFLHTVN